MTVATVDAQGQPSQRIVLLKGVDAGQFVFYTNYESRKAGELDANPRVSLHFPWHALERQVKVCGTATKVPTATSLAYFLSRPPGQSACSVGFRPKPSDEFTPGAHEPVRGHEAQVFRRRNSTAGPLGWLRRGCLTRWNSGKVGPIVFTIGSVMSWIRKAIGRSTAWRPDGARNAHHVRYLHHPKSVTPGARTSRQG